MDLAWLIDLFEQKNPETGEFAYRRVEIEDLIATFLLTVGFNPRATPPVLLGVVEAFAERAGVEAGEDRAASQAKIQRYLDENPLNPTLRVTFERNLRESLAAMDTGALTEAFAKFASTTLEKRAFDGGRPEGTRPGYLALLAHEDVD